MPSVSLLLAALAHGAVALKYRQPGEVSQSLVAEDSKNGMKAMFPFYHSSVELRDEMTRLTSGCAGATASFSTMNSSHSDVSIDMVHVKGKDAKPINRVFLMCGEHSRELISPESCLHLLKHLCGEAKADDGKPSGADVLKHSEFQMIVNANPRSRLKVEAGEFCVRENPRGVDLNRNWDEHFQTDAVMSDTHPGPRPFSEPETQLHKEIVSKFKPTTYLSIHSGTLGMYMPWAFDSKHLASRNQVEMMEVLKKLDTDHCHCPYGAAGKEVGYDCPGTSLDWVYDKMKAPYAFAFEIWVGPRQVKSLRRRWEEKQKSAETVLLQEGQHHLAHPKYVDLFQQHSSDFVQVAQRHEHSSEAAACFGQYNPGTKEEYESAVQNWATAYLETAQLIAEKLQAEEGNADKMIV